VDHALTVQVIESDRDLTADLDHVIEDQIIAFREGFAKAGALHQLHGDEEETVLFVQLVDGNHVRMTGSCGSNFAPESLAVGRIVRRHIEDLDRDAVTYLCVQRRPDRARAAAAEQILEHEPADQGIAGTVVRTLFPIRQSSRHDVRYSVFPLHDHQPTPTTCFGSTVFLFFLMVSAICRRRKPSGKKELSNPLGAPEPSRRLPFCQW